MYDPSFLLTFFYYAIQVFESFNASQFLLNSGFQLSALSLSLQTPEVRATAYDVLASFQKKLTEEVENPEKVALGASVLGRKGKQIVGGSGTFAIRNSKQIVMVLDSLKNGITQKNQRVPGVVAHFVSEIATRVICRPEHFLYPTANAFFLRSPYLKFNEIPMFRTLFYSSKADSFARERSWILQILVSGISDADDLYLCQKKNLFSTLTAFADSGYDP